ncbi:MAG: ribonuclease P protein component [Zoogloeaceae bacterium]|nr:ribonuclease P protein component [Zoogloeaceae bacterium]
MPVEPKDAPASAPEAAAGGDRRLRGAYRLRKTDEFSSVFAFRKALRGRRFEMRYRPNSVAGARIGVVIAKKFVRSAVNRNRVKRIVRESFRLSRERLPHCDIVVRVTARLETFDKRALRAEMDELFVSLIR